MNNDFNNFANADSEDDDNKNSHSRALGDKDYVVPARSPRRGNTPVTQAQFTVKCKVTETQKGTEVLSFSFRLGPVKVICIANIPEEGQDTAPVYVKFELNDPNEDRD